MVDENTSESGDDVVHLLEGVLTDGIRYETVVDKSDLIPLRGKMPIHSIITDIDLAIIEPSVERWVGVIEDFCGWDVPIN